VLLLSSVWLGDRNSERQGKEEKKVPISREAIKGVLGPSRAVSSPVVVGTTGWAVAMGQKQ